MPKILKLIRILENLMARNTQVQIYKVLMAHLGERQIHKVRQTRMDLQMLVNLMGVEIWEILMGPEIWEVHMGQEIWVALMVEEIWVEGAQIFNHLMKDVIFIIKVKKSRE
jgi:hypothetical protein